MPRDDKVAILKDSLSLIGRRIEHVLNQKEEAGEDRQRWRRHLWRCVFFLESITFILNLSVLSVLKFRDALLAKESQGIEA